MCINRIKGAYQKPDTIQKLLYLYNHLIECAIFVYNIFNYT